MMPIVITLSVCPNSNKIIISSFDIRVPISCTKHVTNTINTPGSIQTDNIVKHIKNDSLKKPYSSIKIDKSCLINLIILGSKKHMENAKGR